MKRERTRSQAGNVFFTLFGAVALVGAVGAAATGVMRGPMKTMADVSQRAMAESQIIANTKLVTMSVAHAGILADQDCDKDGIIEAIAWATGSGPINGGLFPASVPTSSQVDPWGTTYGYCVWDHGLLVDDALCGGAGQNRLPGINTTAIPAGVPARETVIAVMSAGANRTFETTCNDWATADGNADGDLFDVGDVPLVETPNNSDDLVMSFTYAEAEIATSSNWKLKDDETAIAEIDQDKVEVNNDTANTNASAQFQGMVDLTTGGLLLAGDPGDDSISGACNTVNENALRRNTSTTPATLEICSAGAWTAISGGGGGSPSINWEAITETKITPADGAAGDEFGFASAFSGDYTVIGAPKDDDNGSTSGSAYVFNTTTGAQLFKLKPADGAAGDQFGSFSLGVGVSGNNAIIGSRQNDDNGADSGSAYIFDVTTGAELFKLLPADGAAGDFFGFSVAISGNNAIIGARADADNGADSGSAYIFNASTGAELFKLKPADGAADDFFGGSVAISGNNAVIAARRDDDNGANSGSAYIFNAATGTELFKLLPADGAADDNFGNSVAVSGNYAVIGSNQDDDNGADSGSAYVFDATTGTQLFKLVPADNAAGDKFGTAVAVSGNYAAIGATGDDDNGSASGSIYIFDITDGTEVKKITPSDGAADDNFGTYFSMSSNVIVVGANLDDDNGADSGSAYIFRAEPALSSSITETKILASDGAADDNFSYSVAVSGSTAVVGAYGDDDNGGFSGSAYIFDTTTGTEMFKLIPADNAGGDQFGLSVAVSGDTAIIGAFADDDNGSASGSAYVFDTITGTELFKLVPADNAAGDELGKSVAVSGDYAVVGARLHNGAAGAAYVFDVTTGAELFKLVPADNAAGDRFGISVAISGTTAVIGATGDADNGGFSGSAYVFDVTTGAELFKLLPADGGGNDEFGGAVSVSGNYAAIGAKGNDDNGADSGSAYVFDVTTGAELFKLLPADGAASDEFGLSVAVSGITAVIGTYLDDDNGASSGAAYLFDVTTGEQLMKLVPADNEAGDNFGSDVAISGSTAVIGAIGDDDTASNAGAAYIYTGLPNTAEPGIGVAMENDFTTDQQVTQTATAGSTGGSHGLALELDSDEHGHEAGIAMRIDSTLGDDEFATAVVSAMRAGVNGEGGLAFKTLDATSALKTGMYLDPDGDLGMGGAVHADVHANVQIGTHASGEWAGGHGPIPTDGLVGYWPLNNTSGTTATAVVGPNGSLTSYASPNDAWHPHGGKVAGALNISRTDASYVAVPYNANLKPADSGGAISAWVYPTAKPGQGRVWGIYKYLVHSNPFVVGLDFHFKQAGANDPMYMKYRLGNSAFGGPITNVESSKTPIALNQWHHVILTWDENNGYMYLNGELEKSGGKSSFGAAQNQQTWIGRTSGVIAIDSGTGLIDEVRFYNRRLTPAEVKALASPYTRGVLATGSDTDLTIPNLLGHWKLDETTGANIVDSGSGGNNGAWTDAVNDDVTEETVTGKRDTAITFDGTDDIIDMGVVPALQITGDITYGLWFNANTITAEDHLMSYALGGESLATNILYYMNLQAGGDLRYFHEYGAGNNEFNDFNTNLATGTWHHAMFVRDDTAKTVTLYVNGTQFGSPFTYTNSAEDGSTGKFEIGNITGFTRTFDGSIDDVRVYDRALTAEEVNFIYSNTIDIVSYFGAEGDNDAGATVLYNKNLRIQDVATDGTGAADIMTLDSLGTATFLEENLDIEATDKPVSGVTYSNTATDGNTVALTRQRGTDAAPTTVATGDVVGSLAFSGYDGTAIDAEGSAGIYAKVNGTVATGSVPVDLHFNTNPAGSFTGGSDMVITNDGNVGIGTTAPDNPLHVADRIMLDDGLKIGTEGDGACSAITIGTMRANGSIYEYCDGSDWQPLVGTAVSLPQTISVGFGWGSDFGGALGNSGFGGNKSSPVPVVNIPFVKIDTGNARQSCGLTNDGKAYCWGTDTDGELGNGAGVTANQEEPYLVTTVTDFVDIAVGASGFTCGVASTGTAYCWGNDTNERLGDGPGPANQPDPVAVSNITNFIKIDAGSDHACGVTDVGTVYCWGNNTQRELGDGTATTRDVPVQAGAINTAIDVAVGINFSCALLSSGTVQCWGQGSHGTVGHGDFVAFVVNPTNVLHVTDFVQIDTTASDLICGTTATGLGYCWGRNNFDQLGTGFTNLSASVPARIPGVTNFAKVFGGRFTSCGLTSDGKGYCWGQDVSGGMGNGAGALSATPDPLNTSYTFSDISYGRDRGFAIADNTTQKLSPAMAWGLDTNNQVGNDTLTDDVTSPNLVYGHYDFIQVATGPGAVHACGIVSNGDAYCWGRCNSGACGDNDTTAHDETQPVLVQGGHKWKSLDASTSTTCGITEDDIGYCWGIDSNGKLGNGAATTTAQGLPNLITGNHKWKTLSTGRVNTTCGVTLAGDGYCWGADTNEVLGDGTGPADQADPVLVSGGHKWSFIDAGGAHVCGLTTDGTPYCWGNDGAGRLGNGVAEVGDKDVPFLVTGGHKFRDLSVEKASCGIDFSGDMYCWGFNTNGEAGVGDNANKEDPTLVNVSWIWKDVANGEDHTCGLNSAGKAYCWGDDTDGEVGDGAGAGGNTPQAVDTTYLFKSIAAGSNFSLALMDGGNDHDVNSGVCPASSLVFDDVTNADLNTLYTSNEVTLQGLTGECVLTLASESTEAYIEKDSGGFANVGTHTKVRSGDTVRIVVRSHVTDYDNTINTYLTLGDAKRTHQVSTWDQKYFFLSDALYTGDLDGIYGADTICQVTAEGAGLDGQYRAWISDATTDIATRSTQSPHDYIRPDDVILSNDWADLTSGSPNSNTSIDPNISELGTVPAVNFVWTGTESNGTAHADVCSDWTDGTAGSNGRRGTPTINNSDWTTRGSSTCDSNYHIYCIEQ